MSAVDEAFPEKNSTVLIKPHDGDLAVPDIERTAAHEDLNL
jgi:hypothetical protein